MHPFRELSVWCRAHALALQVHEVTERNYEGRYWPIIDQMRRASVNIASKIAEGSGQATNAEFGRCLAVALGYVRELDYHIQLVRDLGVVGTSDCVRLEARVEQVSKMLTVLRKRVVDDVPDRVTRTRDERKARAGFHSHPMSSPACEPNGTAM